MSTTIEFWSGPTHNKKGRVLDVSAKAEVNFYYYSFEFIVTKGI